MRVNELKRLGLAAALLTTSSVSVAADAYWGIGLGQAEFDMYPFIFDLAGTPISVDIELDDATAYKAFLGLRSGNDGAEIEVSQSEHDIKGSGGAVALELTSVVISGLSYFPLDKQLDLYAKYGFNFWSIDGVTPYGETSGSDGFSFAFGGGVNFRLSKQLSAKLEYQRFNNIDDDFSSATVQQITLNGALHF